jgi:hypothetical protein
MPKSKAKGEGASNKGKGFASREEASDSSGRNVFNTDLPIYKMKPKKNRLNVVEHKVKKFNRNASPGETFHSLVYFVHPDLGPGGKTVVCPKTKGDTEPCPVCEHQYQLFRTKGKEVAKAFRNKKRIAQIVQDRDDKEKGLQLFLHAYNKGYGEALEKRLNGDDEGKYDNWSDAKKGYYASFLGADESVGDDGGSWVTTATVDLEPRKEDLTKLVKQAPSLDEILDPIPSYEKLKKMLAAGKSPKKDEDDDDEDEDTDDLDDEDVDSDDDDDEEADDGDEEDEDGEEDGEGDEEEDDDSDEGDDDEDDEDESDDADEEGEELAEGDMVSHGKGKKAREGKIVKVKGKMATVKFGKKVETVKLADLTAVEDDDDDDEESDDDDDDLDDDDDDDDLEEDDDLDDDEDDDDADEDDDDEDDDDDEEATSGKKKPAKKRGKK